MFANFIFQNNECKSKLSPMYSDDKVRNFKVPLPYAPLAGWVGYQLSKLI